MIAIGMAMIALVKQEVVMVFLWVMANGVVMHTNAAVLRVKQKRYCFI
jgi:hypothetical protein